MKRVATAVIFVLSGVSSLPVLETRLAAEQAKVATGTWTLFVPSEIAWKPGPDSLAPGVKMAILEGDPAKEGFFTLRLLMPDGYRVAPHWHPKVERLTIISGTVNLGTGDRFDAAETKALPAGTYSSMPPKMTHFAWMTGETVLQLSSIGPWQVIYVDPADDPRNKHR
jgi:ChrR Cupin-like domain